MFKLLFLNMTNYSYLKRVYYGKEVKIDYEKLKKELGEIEKSKEDDGYLTSLTDNYNWLQPENPFPDIRNFEDYARRLDDRALCGYLTASTIKKLCKSGLCMSNEGIEEGGERNYPIMYFEEEGWDRLHCFKFFPGTEKVEHGTYAFDFNDKYYEEKFDKEVKSKILDKTEIEELKYEYISNIRENYIQNLIYDTNTYWKKSFLDYEKLEEFDNFDLLMMISGIRPEDMSKDPEKYTKMMKDILVKKNKK